jgi:hypothetical protein
VAEQDHKTVAELASMTYDERVAYFMAHPLEGAAATDAEFHAHHRAKSVLTIALRDAQQAAKRETRRAS